LAFHLRMKSCGVMARVLARATAPVQAWGWVGGEKSSQRRAVGKPLAGLEVRK
jgi:hypothetical protein